MICNFVDLGAAVHSNSHFSQSHGMKFFFSKYHTADVDVWIWVHDFHKIRQLKFYLPFKYICKTVTRRVNRTIYGSVLLGLDY